MVLPENLTVLQPVKKFPAFYGTQFVTPDQSNPCPPSHFLKIDFNITLQSTSRSSRCSLSDFLHMYVINYMSVFR